MSLITAGAESHQIFAKKSLVFGHRGYKSEFIENSLAGIEAAIALGVDGIEIDVFECSTGEILVFHDRMLERLTNGVGYLAEKSFAELRELRLANGEQIPTLAEVLTKVNRRCKINIELKGENCFANVAKVINKFIAEHGWEVENFIVTSFDHPQLQNFHNLMPKIPFGPIITAIPLDYAKFAKEMGATHLIIDVNHAPQKLICDAKERGLKIFVYTVNDVRDILMMQKAVVDAIITDFPNYIL